MFLRVKCIWKKCTTVIVESFKPPGKGQNKKSAAPKVEDANINLNRCDTFKDKMEMGSKHLDGGLMSKPVSFHLEINFAMVFIKMKDTNQFVVSHPKFMISK